MPLYLLYTMVQKSQKWPKTQIKGGGECKQEWKIAKCECHNIEWDVCGED